MKFFIASPRVILPLIIVLGVSVMGLRAADIWDALFAGKVQVRVAYAEEAHASEKKGAAPAAPAGPTATQTTPAPDAPMPALSVTDADTSPAEMEVLRQLSSRREQLEKRGRELDTRESLIKISEQRVDQKIKEMETLRSQLQSMVNQASGAQSAQLENLVKIYETMKPEEASKIFETLDMPVLMGVFQKMKPARSAPILAKMTAEKAKEITVALTKQDQLPQLK